MDFRSDNNFDMVEFIQKFTMSFFEKRIDNVNDILNEIFPESKSERELLFQSLFIFLILYVEFINPSLEKETSRILEYIVNYDKIKFIPDLTITDSIYLIFISFIEADMKSKNNSFLKKIDLILTRNIERVQKFETINFNPKKTPIIKELLVLFEPFFDSIDLLYHFNKNISDKCKII